MENLLTIENRKGKVRLGDSVTKQSVDKAIQDMDMLVEAKAYDAAMLSGEVTMDGKEPLEEMVMEIHSPGGSVLDGYRLYHKIYDLRNQGVKVTAIINSIAASMASVIAMAADDVQIVKGGRMMIHEASNGVHGNAADHQRAADTLESISDEIAQIYADKTGLDKEHVREMMKSETWMGADQAKKLGFADAIITGTGGKFDTPNKSKATNTTMAGFLNKFISALSSDPEKTVENIKAQLLAAEADHEAVTNEIASVKAELVTAQETISTLTAKLADFDSIQAALAEKETEIANLQAQVEITEDKVAEKAAQLLASTGTPAVASDGGITHAPALNELETFLAITDPDERTAYFKANATKIKELQLATK